MLDLKKIILGIILLVVFYPIAEAELTAEQIPALSAQLPEVSYPYPVSYFPLTNQEQNLVMAYMDVKPKIANGKTVLLLHGKNFNAAYWQGTIAQLVKAGYRVVAPDQIGFGKSSKPARFQYSFQQLASNTHNLLLHLGINQVLVVGHSIGGMLATRFALMYPEQTRALILEDPIGLEDWKRYIPYRTVDQLYAAELQQSLASIRGYQRSSYYHGSWKPEYDKSVEILYGWSKGRDSRLIAWNSALQTDMAFTQPVLYEFPDLKMPTLLIIGRLDRTVLGKAWAPAAVKDKLGNYPVLAKQAAAAIPHAKLIIIEGVGHIPHIENPQAFYEPLLDFLTKQ